MFKTKQPQTQMDKVPMEHVIKGKKAIFSNLPIVVK